MKCLSNDYRIDMNYVYGRGHTAVVYSGWYGLVPVAFKVIPKKLSILYSSVIDFKY